MADNCNTYVKPTKVVIAGIEHAAIITHKCGLTNEHKTCQCKCSMTWPRWVKDK